MSVTSEATQEALEEYVQFAKTYSPFYTELYKDLPAHDSTTQIPVVEHSHYWDKNGYINSKVMTGPHVDGIVLRTGGTTSKPKFTAYSQSELQRTASLLATGLISAGLLPGDRVGNLFYAGECYGSYLLHILSVAAVPLPAVQVPIGGQTSAESMEQLIDQCKVNVLLSTPTTLIHLAKQCLQKHKTFRRVRVVMFSGEPLFQDQQPTLQSLFPNATFRSCIYGSIDAGVVAVSASESDPRVHHTVPGVIVEIRTDDIGQQFTQDHGIEGSLIVTNLLRRLTPVIRYPSGDRAEWVDFAKRRFRLLGRDKYSLRLGPVSLDVRDLRQIVMDALPQASIVAFQAVLFRRESKDLLQCWIDATLGEEENPASRIKARLLSERPMLAEHVRTGHIAEPEVIFVSVTEMAINVTTGKFLAVVDHRGTT